MPSPSSFIIPILCLLISHCALAADTLATTSTANPESTSSAPISPGDTISLTLLEDSDVHFEGTIGEAGIIRLPYLGDFRIAGLTVEQATTTLEKLLVKDLYQKATLSLHIVNRAPGLVYVYGAVKEPGAVPQPVTGPMTVLQVISNVGGITAWADAGHCVVTRINSQTHERETIPVDLHAAFRDIGGANDLTLKSNDVLFVPTTNAENNEVLSSEPVEVIVVGEVNSPGIILFAPGENRTVMRAIFKAGNFTRFAKSKEVRVVRANQGNREVMKVDVQQIIDEGLIDKDIALEPGDMVIVDQKMFSFQ